MGSVTLLAQHTGFTVALLQLQGAECTEGTGSCVSPSEIVTHLGQEFEREAESWQAYPFLCIRPPEHTVRTVDVFALGPFARLPPHPPRISPGPPLSSFWMVIQLLGNLHLQVAPTSLLPALISPPWSKFSSPSNSQASNMGDGNHPCLSNPQGINSPLDFVNDCANICRGDSADQQSRAS